MDNQPFGKNNVKDIQVAILAGGRGTRLGIMTDHLPKPMVDVLGKPFLEYQIMWLVQCGIRRVTILTGYLSHLIQEYFQEGKKWGVNINYSEEKTPLGTAGALKNAEVFMDNFFLLLNGDTFLPIDYNDVVDKFKTSSCDASIIVYENKECLAPNNIKLLGDRIVRYDKSGAKSLTHIDAGAYAFNFKVLKEIPENAKYSLEEHLFPKMVEDKCLGGIPVNTRYFDIGTPERLNIFIKEVPKYFRRN